MPSPDPSQRLRSLDQSSSRFPNELTNLLHDQGYKDGLKSLRDEDSLRLIEYLDNVRSQAASTSPLPKLA